jgi:hypothetical protein
VVQGVFDVKDLKFGDWILAMPLLVGGVVPYAVPGVEDVLSSAPAMVAEMVAKVVINTVVVMVLV